jgi:ribosomal protein S18 acetylase RimI-like enzyme
MLTYNIFSLRDPQPSERKGLKELFQSVGWEAGNEPDWFYKAISNSGASVYAAITPSRKLVGWIRVWHDDVWQANIDCLVVRKERQNIGIGTALMNYVLKELKDVKYINVCTNFPETIPFYEKFGFKDINGRFLQKENKVERNAM